MEESEANVKSSCTEEKLKCAPLGDGGQSSSSRTSDDDDSEDYSLEDSFDKRVAADYQIWTNTETE